MKKWTMPIIIIAIIILLKSQPSIMGIYPTCDDPDTNNMFIKGTTTYGGSTIYTDKCVQGSTKVVEYLCLPQEGKFVYNFRVYECTYGCSNGACMRNPEEVKTIKTVEIKQEKTCSEWKNCIMGKEGRECQICSNGSCDVKFTEYKECEKEDYWRMFIFGGYV